MSIYLRMSERASDALASGWGCCKRSRDLPKFVSKSDALACTLLAFTGKLRDLHAEDTSTISWGLGVFDFVFALDTLFQVYGSASVSDVRAICDLAEFAVGTPFPENMMKVFYCLSAQSLQLSGGNWQIFMTEFAAVMTVKHFKTHITFSDVDDLLLGLLFTAMGVACGRELYLFHEAAHNSRTQGE